MPAKGFAPCLPHKFNRYSDLLLFDAQCEKGLQVRLSMKMFCLIGAPPRLLRERFPAVRYLASSLPVSGAAGAGFVLLSRSDTDHLWLYAADGPLPAPAAP